MSALKLSFIIEAIDRATAPIKSVQRMLESATGPLARVTESWGRLSGQARGLATNLAFMTGAGAAAFFPLHRMIGEGEQIHNFAKNLSISTTEFQRLAYAITQDGGSITDAGNALKFLENNASAAVDGAKEIEKWFRRGGISFDFLRANLRNPVALMEQLAEGISKLPEGVFRSAVLTALLNKTGIRLVQTMSQGKKGLREVGDEAASLGIILDEATIAKMSEADNGMQKVWKVLGSITALIAVEAIPLIKQVGDAIIDWTKANRALIQRDARLFFTQISESLPKIIEGVTKITAALGVMFGAVTAIASLMGGWDNLIIGLVGVRFAMLIAGVVKLGMAIGAFGLALIANPIGGFIVLVGLLATLGVLVYKNWEPLSEFFTDLWAGIKSAFGAAIDWISEKIAFLGHLVAAAVGKLNALQPEWMKSYTLPGMALNAVATSIGGPPGAGKTNLGGTLKIEINEKGRARVAELRSDNSEALDFEVYLGNLISP